MRPRRAGTHRRLNAERSRAGRGPGHSEAIERRIASAGGGPFATRGPRPCRRGSPRTTRRRRGSDTFSAGASSASQSTGEMGASTRAGGIDDIRRDTQGPRGRCPHGIPGGDAAVERLAADLARVPGGPGARRSAHFVGRSAVLQEGPGIGRRQPKELQCIRGRQVMRIGSGSLDRDGDQEHEAAGRTAEPFPIHE